MTHGFESLLYGDVSVIEISALVRYIKMGQNCVAESTLKMINSKKIVTS